MLEGDPKRVTAIVVGAGPAGLAVAACLGRAQVPYRVLEREQAVSPAWRRHYSRLHLHTSRRYSELPFVGFPRGTPRYPSRQQVVDYLEAYSRALAIEPRFGEEVVEARPVEGEWEVRTRGTTHRAPHLVVASGYNREPVLPDWPGRDEFAGPVVHSSAYRDGEPYRGQRVLVVGFGNSGGEIAVDLVEHGAEPTMAVRGPVNVVPREIFGVPVLALGILQSRLPTRLADRLNGPLMRLLVGDLSRWGLRPLPIGPQAQIRERRRIPLIDVGTIEWIKRGRIAVRPGIERFTPEGVRFTDGREERFDAAILATGYRPRVNEFLRGAETALDGDGCPLASGGATGVPGLHFCGFYVSPTGMLREIALEARKIAARVASDRAA